MANGEHWVIDASLISGGYAFHLCEAMAVQEGPPVRLIARPLRRGEPQPPAGVIYDPVFYRFGEWLTGLGTGRVTNLGAKAMKGLEHNLGLWRLVAKARRDRPAGINISQMVLPNFDIWAVRELQKVCPVAVTVHNSVPLHGVLSPMTRNEHFYAVYRLADAIFTHSAHTRSAILGWGVPAERIVMISHPPLDLVVEQQVPDEASDGRFRVLLWGAIKPYKGADVLVEATALAKAKVPTIQARVVGKAFYDTRALEARATQPDVADHVELSLAFKTDAGIDEELRLASAVVFPYSEIDVSGALPTSMGYDKPIILSRVGGFAEFDIPPEAAETALMEPGDVQGLADRLVRLATDAAARAANVAAFRRMRDSAATWADVARTVRQTLARLAQQRP